jgi:arginase
LAIVWIDSNPDIGTPASQYPGFHAMAVSALIGHSDPDMLALLPATVTSNRVALVGLHEWTDDDFPNVAAWGIRSFSPDELRDSAQPLLDWLAATECSKVAIHFDVDTIDSNEIVLGLGAAPNGLTISQVRRIVADVNGCAAVVGLTIAEFFPRQVMHLQQILHGSHSSPGTDKQSQVPAASNLIDAVRGTATRSPVIGYLSVNIGRHPNRRRSTQPRG